MSDGTSYQYSMCSTSGTLVFAYLCPLSDRLPLESFVHHETYRDYTARDIDTYYLYKEQLEENRHFVEINHKETLAQIFTDIRYTKNDNEAMSAGLIEALKHQGFL